MPYTAEERMRIIIAVLTKYNEELEKE